MRADEAGNCAATRLGVLFDFALSKPPDSPTALASHLIEASIAFPAPVLANTMPVIPVSLDDKANVLKHEVRLESTEHRFMHFKLEPTLAELFHKSAFYGGHLGWPNTAQSSLAVSLAGFLAQMAFGFPHLCFGLSRALAAPVCGDNLFSIHGVFPPFFGHFPHSLQDFWRPVARVLPEHLNVFIRGPAANTPLVAHRGFTDLGPCLWRVFVASE